MSGMITIDTGESATKIIEHKYDRFELVEENDPILKQIAEEFNFSSENAVELSGRLTETLKTHRAYGIAAPQCGISRKVFVMGFDKEYMTLFNPKIVRSSLETVHMEEGCLSFPFLSMAITRPKDVTVSYQDVDGNNKKINLTGISARVAQHEIDHLNGITFDKVAKPLALKSSLKRREKRIKSFARELIQQRRIESDKNSI
jgi:peptide deformylase